MDDMQESKEDVRLSSKDEAARRVASLALELINARRPLDATYINAHIYPDLDRDSFFKALGRDCERLAACGMHVVRTTIDDGLFYQIDEKNSYIGDAQLTQEEALELQVLLSPQAANPAFPLADELRMALLKIDRSFAEQPLVATRRPKKGPDRTLPTLRDAYGEHVLAEVAYTDAAGNQSSKVLAPYGFFSFRDTLYCVCAEEKDSELQEPKTYRIDRMGKAKLLPGRSYAVPDSFEIEDFRALPFQMGPEAGTAIFSAAHPQPDLLSLMKAHGTLEEGNDGTSIWQVPASSWDAAASWGIAQGLVPLGPDDLISAAKACLEGAIADA
ncbi:MAG: helix-turn-helix transcriptional regulator [Atopobiaceae bacterium]